MALRDEAIFINGVFGSVLEEVLTIQDVLPTQTMFLQPHSGKRIVHLAKSPPSIDDRVQLFISLTTKLDEVSHVAEIVGWDDKRELLKNEDSKKTQALQRLVRSLQPGEGGLYSAASDGGVSTNLLHVWRLRPLAEPFSATTLIKTTNGLSYEGGRISSGWIYVQRRDVS